LYIYNTKIIIMKNENENEKLQEQLDSQYSKGLNMKYFFIKLISHTILWVSIIITTCIIISPFVFFFWVLYYIGKQI